MNRNMKQKFFVALVFSLMVHIGVGAASGLHARAVSESERMIPLAYDVDVIVVGGTLRGVAAAEAAAQAGAKVFLITDRPYLGEDVCATQRLWIKPDAKPKTDLGRSIYGDASGARATENGYRVVRPMDVKRKLDEALLRSKVDYLYGSYVTEVLHDPKGELAGVVAANRSGRQAIRGKVIVDATDRASVARIAGAEFTPYPSGLQRFKRIIVGGKPNPAAKDLGFKYTVFSKPQKNRPGKKQYTVYEYDLEIPMKDGSWASFVHADKIARDKTYHFGQATYSEKLFQVPPDPVRSLGAHTGPWVSAENIPLSAMAPKGMGHIYVLGGCAEVSRSVAADLLRPVNSLDWGKSVGEQVAAIADSRSLAPASKLVVAGHGGEATIQAEVGDVLTGLRWKPSEGAVRSPARALPVFGRYDTVVVGGGTGGAAAGIGAARAGARTLVIEHLHGLGGVGTLGRISIYYHGNKAGFNAEVERKITALSDEKLEPWQGNVNFDIETKMEWLRNEINKAGGEIWYLALGVGSVVQDKRFTGVVVATPDGRGVILANTVIDSTGNSVIPHCAGLETQMIDHEHISVQGTGLPPWHPGENMRNSDWTFAHDDDVMDMWRIHVVAKKKFKEDYDLGQLIDSRVRRRIYGDVLITPMDILNQRVFPDVITVASSDFDNHGFSSHDLFMVYRQEREELKGNIPYRALLPKGYDGILVTGLGISGHGDAMPVIRMQRDIENHSYAAGYASAMAAREQSTVRKIDVRKLQRHLVDIGTIPEKFIGAEDSYPLGQEVIQEAVKSLGRDYSGIAQILTQPEMAIPLMREAYRSSDLEEVKLRYAHVLGLLYDNTGAESLLRAVGSRKWDKGWRFRGLGNYGSTTSPLDNLIIALGRTGDERAVPVLIEKAGQLGAKSELSHFRAIAVAFENLRHPDAAETLAKLLKLPGTRGNAFTGIDKVLKRTPNSHGDNTTREVSLRELILARSLYRCGDYGGIGRKTLEAYSNDLRGHYAIHARAVLAENVPKVSHSKVRMAKEKVPFSGVDEALKAKTGKLGIGAERCTDSQFRITAFLEDLKGAHFLTVARGDHDKPGAGYEFTVDEAGTVYLVVLKRGKLPELQGWAKTASAVKWATGNYQSTDEVYSKKVKAGDKVIVPAHTGSKDDKGKQYGIPHMVLMKCVSNINGDPQDTEAFNVKSAIKMAETVIAETALEKGQKPTRYNYWMYQNYMIAEGIKAMGDALGRAGFSSYKEKQLMYFCEEYQNFKHGSKSWFVRPLAMWRCGMVAGLVELQEKSKHPAISRGMNAFQDFLDNTRTVSDGTLARIKGHWQSNGVQIDDLYMISPYWVRKSKQSGNTEYLEKAIEETLSYYKHLWNPETKLLHCLWLEKKPNVKIPHWGRGNGWFVMAITDLLHFVPEEHPQRARLLEIYNNVMLGLMARQNKDGLWHQVLDHPESYTETSCSGMFTYSLLHGSAQGWLPASARVAGLRGWNGLQAKLTDENQLKDVCVGTDMSADLDYFFKRSRVTHDQHGIGPYLLAAAEVIKLKKK